MDMRLWRARTAPATPRQYQWSCKGRKYRLRPTPRLCGVLSEYSATGCGASRKRAPAGCSSRTTWRDVHAYACEGLRNVHIFFCYVHIDSASLCAVSLVVTTTGGRRFGCTNNVALLVTALPTVDNSAL